LAPVRRAIDAAVLEAVRALCVLNVRVLPAVVAAVRPRGGRTSGPAEAAAPAATPTAATPRPAQSALALALGHGALNSLTLLAALDLYLHLVAGLLGADVFQQLGVRLDVLITCFGDDILTPQSGLVRRSVREDDQDLGPGIFAGVLAPRADVGVAGDGRLL